MASAKSDVVKSVTVTLTMNEDEAYYLHSLLRSIAGGGKLRDLNSEICTALLRAAVGNSAGSVFRNNSSINPALKEDY